jgi:hypothetical protein
VTRTLEGVTRPPKPTRTIGPLHFEDLAPLRFEDLVRQLAYRFRVWLYLDATGAGGTDGGSDIKGIELDEAGDASVDELEMDEQESAPSGVSREWRIQCKRYRRVGPREAKKIAKELIPDLKEPPYGVILAAPANLSATAISHFRAESLARGASEAHVWARAGLEDMMFLPENDHLLFAYFGISLRARERAGLVELRRRLTVKSRALRAVGATGPSDFASTDANLLIRDVDDTVYPDERAVAARLASPCRPWQIVAPFDLHPQGLAVVTREFTGWLREDHTWDIVEESGETPWMGIRRFQESKPEEKDSDAITSLTKRIPPGERVDVVQIGLILYDRVVEVDRMGDSQYPFPQCSADSRRTRARTLDRCRTS